MIEDIENEAEVLNSIFGEHTLRRAPDVAHNVYHLIIPQQDVTLRLSIPSQYPDVILHITAVESVGGTVRKGYGSHVLEVAREVVQDIFTPGQVCIFDLLQDLAQRFSHESTEDDMEDNQAAPASIPNQINPPIEDKPQRHWTLSSTVIEKKSVFLARACAINSTSEAQDAIAHLLSTDKRVSKATHNINAYRVQILVDGHQIVYQDCDDDGEDAAGGHLLKLLQIMDVWNVLVVVSRWYGGVKLGSARFGIINAAARDAIVAAGFAKDAKPHR
ncbi:MAG: hypothetical protein Q9169_002027 [Polycauliona sp. 2 TL-2023]